MAKKTKKEIMDVIGTLEGDVSISLLEDLEDSWVDSNTEIETLQSENNQLKDEVKDLKEKYKQRFLESGKTESIKNNTDSKNDEGLREPRKFENLFDEKGGLK